AGGERRSGGDAALLHLFGRRGRALELDDKYAAALASYAEMEALAGELGDRPLRLAALIGCAGARSAFTAMHDAVAARGRLDGARAALGAAGQLWRELENLPMLIDSEAGASFLSFFDGDFGAALAAADEGLRIASSIGSHWGPARIMRTVGLVWFERGEV